MKKFLALFALLALVPMDSWAISAAAKYELNNRMGGVAHKYQLGTLLDTATPTTITTTGAATLGSTLAVTGAATLSSSLAVTGAITNALVTDSTTKDTGAVILEGGVGVEKAVNIGTTLGVLGAATISGDIIGDGGDQIYGYKQDQVASTTTAATIAQCGKTFVSDSTDIITLPEASTALGCRYTFVCGTADDFHINPADASDTIGPVGSITGANTTTVLAPSAGDRITCTDIGSSLTLEAVGADLWVVIGGTTGTWTDTDN